ncbi:unnamed protein product, partial [Coregonus sp. 'balchen']
MNMVKRIMGRPRQEECSPQDNALGLMHLRRLFSELCHPPRQMTQKEQEEKLYMMLPVFNRVFGNAPPSTMTEKFQDLLQFTTQVSRLMVTEIRRRASNKSTEAASRAIVQFLEVNQSEEASRGWMLLTTINLLASSGQKTVDCMTTMSVPSTLVKCLYLFFDLPHMAEAPGTSQTQTSELPLADRRALLQKVFVQILVKLCSFVSPAEELAQKDDLQLLFSAITSWCPPHNLPWRKSSGQVLTTISRHGLSKECLATCIQNMQQSDDLSPLEIVEMFAGLSCFLKDSSDVSQTLLDDFRILEQAKEEDSSDALKDLVNLVTCLTTYGVTELKPAGLTTGAPFFLPGFVLPQPSGKGHTVRNLQSFSVLQNAFLRAKTSLLTTTLLDAIGNIYAADPANYFILEAQHTLSQFADKVAKLPDAQTKYFELLEFVVFSLNYVPCKELTLLKLSRHDAVFSDVLREVGLLEVLVNLLHKYAALLKDPATQQQQTQPQNSEQGAVRTAWSGGKKKQLAWPGHGDSGCLLGRNQVFELLHTVFCTLTAAMRYEPANSHFFRTEIQYEKLADAVRLLGCFSEAKKVGATGVFPSNAQPFLRLLEDDGVVAGGGAGDSVCPTLKHCSKLFIYLYKMATDSFDRYVVRGQVPPPADSRDPPCRPPGARQHSPGRGVRALTDLNLKLHLANSSSSSSSSSDSVVIHPGAGLAMLDLLASVSSDSQPEHALDLQLAVANILQQLVHSERNQQILCEAGLHSRLLQRCSQALGDEEHPLHPPLQRMFERLASQALQPMALREFLRLGNPLNCGAWDKKLLKHLTGERSVDTLSHSLTGERSVDTLSHSLTGERSVETLSHSLTGDRSVDTLSHSLTGERSVDTLSHSLTGERSVETLSHSLTGERSVETLSHSLTGDRSVDTLSHSLTGERSVDTLSHSLTGERSVDTLPHSLTGERSVDTLSHSLTGERSVDTLSHSLTGERR